jgi:putative colanic acid biosynthesis UDP-glucose lipid carrier transferase
MKTVNEKLRSGIKLAADLLILNAAYLCAYFLVFHSPFFGKIAVSQAEYRVLLTFANLLYIVVHMLPLQTMLSTKKSLFVNTSETIIRYFLFIASYLGVIVFSQGYEFSRSFHLSFLLILIVLSICGDFTLVPFIEKSLLPGSFRSRILVIEGVEPCGSLIDRLKGSPIGYELIGVLDDSEPRYHKVNGHYRGSIDQLEEIIGKIGVDEIVIMSPLKRTDSLARIMGIGKANHVLTRIVPSQYDALIDLEFKVERWLGLPVATISSHRLTQERNQILKRIIDITLASCFIVMAFPIIFLVAGPAIWLSSKGPVFFKQLRKGYRGGAFLCYKFRTMRLMDKCDEVVQAKSDDPRKTRIGHFLRSTNLDEIPQLFNVLKGEMSLVGPRPHMIEHDELYSGLIKQYKVRLIAKPGLTGWAQVNGYRGTTDDPKLMLKRVEHDIWYIENWSLRLDMKILFQTIFRMFKGDPNAY